MTKTIQTSILLLWCMIIYTVDTLSLLPLAKSSPSEFHKKMIYSSHFSEEAFRSDVKYMLDEELKRQQMKLKMVINQDKNSIFLGKFLLGSINLFNFFGLGGILFGTVCSLNMPEPYLKERLIAFIGIALGGRFCISLFKTKYCVSLTQQKINNIQASYAIVDNWNKPANRS